MSLGLLLVLALSLTAQSPAPSPSPAPGAATKPAGEETAGNFAMDSLTYTYNPFGKRDPFHSYLLENENQKKDNTDPLLNYDLSKFKLTGILSGVANPRGIVRDGDNHGHIIMKGTRMGRNKGQVVSITRDKIIVAEEFRDPLGKLIVSEVTIKLEKDHK